MVTATPIYRYRVDAADALIWVDDLWLAFARENGAADLTEQAVLGRTLWEFIMGEETRHLYRAIHARVRTHVKSVVLPFRCDSPTLQRHMRLTITRETMGHLRYDSMLVRVVPQDEQPLLNPRRPRSLSVVTMCSCCKRALLESAGWLEAEDFTARLGLFNCEKVPQIRHTLCPDCIHAAVNDLSAEATSFGE